MRHCRHFVGPTLAAVTSVTLAVAVAAAPPSRGAPVPAPTSAGGTAQKVIVVLRDQLPAAPASKTNMAPRRALAVSAQDAVIADMVGARPAQVKHYGLGNAFAATVTAAQAAQLSGDPRVAAVVPDRIVTLPQPAASTAGRSAQTRHAAPYVDTNGRDAICPSDPAHPLIEPEALRSIRALTTDGTPNAQQLATGAGVKVAFIADTLNPDNADFIGPHGRHVFVDYQDFSGAGPSAPSDGREAFGDASSIAAQGTVVHDLSNFVNEAHPLPAGCTVRIVGVAPGSSLVGLVFGSNSSILQAIDYAVSIDRVDVINESFGLNTYPDESMRNALTLFNNAAVAAGVTITVSSGDAGITNTIGSPPNPKVITVAGTTDNRLYEQTSYAAANFSNGQWVSDNISALSSSGLTQYARTVDLAAPGEGNWAVCDPAYTGCRDFKTTPRPTDIQSFGGTSESAPLTAGVAALVIQAYRSKHRGATPSPALVKRLITGTARDLGLPADEQGAGLLDARAAVEAAITYPGGGRAPVAVKSNLITSRSQFTLTGKPGRTRSGHVTVTNVGTKRLTVAAGARGYAPLASSNQSVTFDSRTLPSFVYFNGATWAYKKVTFTVPRGGQRLLARMAFRAKGPDDIVRLTLLDPSGRLVANSRPQGGTASANYANVDVRKPVAGTWTAVLYSAAGTTGYHATPILLQFDTQKTTRVGRISPAVFRLNPGQRRKVTATFTLPPSSGGTDYAVTFASSAGQKTAVSAVLDTLIDTKHAGAYSGLITGGNARGVSPGQTFSYGFSVPAGKRDLDVSLKLARDPNDFVDLVLLDPNGELADVGSNITFDASGNLAPSLTAQLFHAHPKPGRWRLVVVVQNPVSGAEISQAFTGRIRFNTLRTSASGLPTSEKSVLTAGQPVTATIRVRNTGVQSIVVGIDPRLNKQRTLQLVPVFGRSSFDLPDEANDAPAYIVPPDTSGLTVTAISDVPAQVEIQEGSSAGVDLSGDLRAAQAGSAVSVARIQERVGDEITKGLWFSSVNQVGPYTDAGAPPGHTTVTASVRTAPFDPAVASSTDDPFRIAVDPTSDGFGTPELIPPGATASIQVTITPVGHRGAVVSGHLNIVVPPLLPTGPTALPQVTTGGTIATIPYEYKVG